VRLDLADRDLREQWLEHLVLLVCGETDMIVLGYIFVILLAMLSLFGAYRIGVVRGIRRGPSTAISSMCPCDHQWGSHRKGGECQDRVYRSGDGWRHCPCTRYHGPEVLMTSDLFGPGAIGQ